MGTVISITANLEMSFEARCCEAKESLLKHWRPSRIETRPRGDFLRTLWKWRLQFTREMYGSDATDFALRSIKNIRGRD